MQSVYLCRHLSGVSARFGVRTFLSPEDTAIKLTHRRKTKLIFSSKISSLTQGRTNAVLFYVQESSLSRQRRVFVCVCASMAPLTASVLAPECYFISGQCCVMFICVCVFRDRGIYSPELCLELASLSLPPRTMTIQKVCMPPSIIPPFPTHK